MPRSRVANGPVILAKRELLGVSQKEMAERIGVSASYLCRIESGTEQPGLATGTVHKLARELGLSPEEITKPLETAAAVTS
jgi:transcriptional regulator with XRE-family HTH domain